MGDGRLDPIPLLEFWYTYTRKLYSHVEKPIRAPPPIRSGNPSTPKEGLFRRLNRQFGFRIAALLRLRVGVVRVLQGPTRARWLNLPNGGVYCSRKKFAICGP